MGTISIALIFIIIIATVCILLFVKPNTNNKKRTVSKQYNEIVTTVEYHNTLIQKYNETNQNYMIAMQKKERDIILCNDFDAQEMLQKAVSEYEVTCNIANDYIRRSNECINIRDSAGSLYCLEQLNQTLQDMDCIIRSFEKITPKMQQTYETPTIHAKEEAPSLQFFTGCNTKEEIEARYRSLAKAFHPDSKGGDETMFRQMMEEYKNLEGNV